MISVALRFSENFSPECGTIKAHQNIIDSKGYVWYGKMGSPLSEKTISMLMENDTPRILLIHSGGINRYWATVDKVQREVPPLNDIPEYYRDMANVMKTWFRVSKIELASKKVMGQCRIKSSGARLSETSKHSMSPYFIIKFNEEGGD